MQFYSICLFLDRDAVSDDYGEPLAMDDVWLDQAPPLYPTPLFLFIHLTKTDL
ncbi:MAG: hypothetical protein KKD44_25495 [Proteobacteria bacterium]|nr:hypothetical protein [Pseudomonadota bacterium]